MDLLHSMLPLKSCIGCMVDKTIYLHMKILHSTAVGCTATKHVKFYYVPFSCVNPYLFITSVLIYLCPS